jgi:N-acetylneuraminate lyase
MDSQNKFRGVFPALITPFKNDGSINEASLRALIQLNLKKGVTGFYVDGSSAEAFLLSQEERKQLLEIASSEAKGKCTLIAHIGAIGTDHALDLAQRAKKLGYDAVSAIPPFYYKFTNEEIKGYYRDIVAAVDMPIIVYNFPAFSGVTLTCDDVRSFRTDKRFIGVKFTSTDLFQLQQMKAIDDELVVFNGFDEMFLGGLSMGATGGIGSTYNFMAEKFVEIYKLFQAGKIREAQKIQNEANEIITALVKVGVFQGEKYALTLQGIDAGPCRKPFLPITEEGKKLLKGVLARCL